ncbi:hypothetical protein ACFL96_13480 [Thermoproteota archaeon]
MLGIAHFAVGVLVMALLLKLFDFKKELKWDVALILGGGIFAMIPDLSKVFPSWQGFHDSVFANIFFGHQLVDLLPDSVGVAILIIAFAGLAILLYYQDIK